jgi:hypothetical protein
MGPRRWLAYVATPILALLAAEIVIGLAAPKLPEPNEWFSDTAAAKVRQMERVASEGKRVSPLLVGASSMNDAGDADMLNECIGESRYAYNASLSGGVAPMMALWVEDVVLARLDPDRVVWGLLTADFAIQSQRYRYLVEQYGRAPATRPGLLGETDRQLRRASALWRHRLTLRDPTQAAMALLGEGTGERSQPWADSVLSEAGRNLLKDPLSFEVPEWFHETYEQDVLKGFKLTGAALEPIGHIARELRSRDIKLDLVLMPVTPVYIRAHPGGERGYERAVAKIQDAAREEWGVPLHRLDRALPSTSFADPVHANGQGAQRFTALLADKLGLARACAVGLGRP